MKHYERVRACIDLDNIEYNMDLMKGNIAKESLMIAVIKADGYGHGAVPIAKTLENKEYLYGFAVATAEEAFTLRNSGIIKPILILGYTFPCFFEELIKKEIRLTIFRDDTLEKLNQAAITTGKKAKVHIKVDTGMNRIGILPDASGNDFIQKAATMSDIEIEGIFTHFAKADESNKQPAINQIAIFNQFVEQIEKMSGIKIPFKHCSNSAGIVELKNANMDLVRAGITLYGLWPSEEVNKDIIEIRPVLSLKSHIVYLKKIQKNTQVSYGGTFTTTRETLLATIPVGYGDGYPRSLSNNGYVLVRGQRAPIVGRICMDQFMVDVTDIAKVSLDDEVVLIGRDEAEVITMEELGERSGRFNYEFACDLGKRIPREYIRGGQVVYTKDYFNEIELLP